MRRDVHLTMLVPALYLVRRADAPIPITVRPHTEFGQADVSGVGEGFAAMLDQTPRIRFKLSELPGGKPPVRGSIVSIAAGEAYTVGAARPPEDEFVFAEVARMAEGETAGLPVP